MRMDREQAFQLLGLYDGAPDSHIESACASRISDLNTQLKAESDTANTHALQAQIEALQTARSVALGRADAAELSGAGTTTGIPTHTPVWKRGPVVLLMLLLALVLCVAGFFVAARSLDNKQAARATAGQHDHAVAARDAWNGYRAKLGLAQTPDGERAEAMFEGAGKLSVAEDHVHAGEDYTTALQMYETAFTAENGRLANEWHNGVVEFWRTNLKTRFPFDSESEEEAALEDVAKLFNPTTGEIWRLVRQFDALASTELEGRSLVSLPDGYSEAVARASQIRTALFSDASEQVNVVFSICMEDTKVLGEAYLETGGARIGHRDKNFTTATWTPTSSGARLLLKKLGERQPTATPLDYGTSSWGMLQMLSYCNYVGEQNGDFVWEVEFESMADRRGKTRSLAGSIHIKLDRTANPFDFATYAGFSPK